MRPNAIQWTCFVMTQKWHLPHDKHLHGSSLHLGIEVLPPAVWQCSVHTSPPQVRPVTLWPLAHSKLQAMDAANATIMTCIKCHRNLKLVPDSWQSRCRTIHLSKIQSSRPKFDFPPFPLPHSKKAVASIVTHKATFITFTTFKTFHTNHIFTKFITDSPRFATSTFTFTFTITITTIVMMRRSSTTKRAYDETKELGPADLFLPPYLPLPGFGLPMAGTQCILISCTKSCEQVSEGLFLWWEVTAAVSFWEESWT